MPTHLLVEIRRITDQAQYERYVAAARPIVRSHGGSYLLTCNHVSTLSGETPPERVVLIRFPDRQALDRCFGSAEYAKVAPLRESSTESRALIIEDDLPAEQCTISTADAEA